MKNLLSILAASLFISCNSGTDEQNKESKDSTVYRDKETPVVKTGSCYMKITGRDTAVLVFDEGGEEFAGKMMFDNYEKRWEQGYCERK